MYVYRLELCALQIGPRSRRHSLPTTNLYSVNETNDVEAEIHTVSNAITILNICPSWNVNESA